MQKVIAFIRQEAVLSAGVALSVAETALSSGSTGQTAVQGAIPLILAGWLRSICKPTTQESDLMADLTALRQAVTDLDSVVTQVQTVVAQLKVDATPQADVDAVTASVAQAQQDLQSAIA